MGTHFSCSASLFTALFGGMGLRLASIGLYGVLADDVTRRTHEMGVRMVLGAGRTTILGEVIARGARLVVPGAIAGVAIGALAWGVRECS